MTVGTAGEGSGEVPNPAGGPDPLEVKARRLLADGRVSVWTSSWRGITADVTGDTGIWHVSVDGDGVSCSCPATSDCSHGLAVALLWDEEKEENGQVSETDEDLEAPFVVEDVPLPEAVGYEEARLSHDDDTPLELETEVVDVQTGEIVPAVTPNSKHDVDLAAAPVTWNTLKSIADTEMVNASLRGRPYAMYAALLYGRELGVGPMQSLQHIAVIDGSAVLSAELQLSRFRNAGHQLRVLRMDDKAVALKGTRGDNGDEMEVVYDLEDAVGAGLVEVDDQGRPQRRSRTGRAMPWQLYTEDLLWARAVTRLVRRLAPDVLGRQ